MVEIGLGFTRNPDESFRDVVVRYGKKYGLLDEVLSLYDDAVANGQPENEAAWVALCEWDLLDITRNSENPERKFSQ